MNAAAALLIVGAALAQAPAGTVEVTADGCKLFLPQSEALGASRIRWSGKCADGFAEGRGVVRLYRSGKISRVSEATFTAGKLTAPGESYSIRSGQAIRSRGGDQLEVSAAELPTWALELSLLVEDKPVRAASRPSAPAAPKVDRGAEQQKIAADKAAADAQKRQVEAKAAADKAAAERDRAMADAKAAAQEAGRAKAAAEAKLAQERAAAADAAAAKAVAEAKVASEKLAAEKAKAVFVAGRGFADGGAGEPLRAVVSFKLTTPEGRELGVATFVAGKGEADIKQNAQSLAAAYEKVSPFHAKLVEQPDVGSICGGPGYVVEARVTYPSAKNYGWYAGCMGDDAEKAAKSMQQLEDEMHRDFKVSPTSFWAYQYLIVGYVDAATMRGRADYERVARPGLMAPGRVMVLSKPEQWAECTGMANKDPKLKDKAGCLREAIDKLKGTLGLR
jgi:hypothetical protein